jgi:hypothetical protein
MQESRLVQGRWLSRSVGITGALVVSFAIAGVISSNLTSKNPNNATRIPAFPAVSKPVDVSKAVVQPAAPATTNSAASGQAPDLAPAAADPTDANKDVSNQRPKLGATVRAQITTPSRTGAVTGTANPPARANKAAEEAAARKLAEDKSRAEREAGDHIKSAVDQKPVVESVQQAPRQNDAAEQAAVKAAEDRASAERAAADRPSIAEEKAAADKAAADRAKAAEMAALQAQQAAKLAQEQEGARQAKAAKDLADKALKDAADREKAEKEADEQYKAERREANRVFAHTLFGFSR